MLPAQEVEIEKMKFCSVAMRTYVMHAGESRTDASTRCSKAGNAGQAEEAERQEASDHPSNDSCTTSCG